jgi:glycerol-1-phosphatase
VEKFEDKPVAVVQGFGPEVGWQLLAEAALAVRAGATWFATNTDRTLPSPRGPLPGNGSLVAVLRTALDREPDVVVGKPQPALFTTAAAMSHAERPLAVGDRLDTDIEGAVGAGMDSLLVLTGVSGPAELLSAPASRRPTYVAADLSGLFRPETAARIPVDATELGGWQITAVDSKVADNEAGDSKAADNEPGDIEAGNGKTVTLTGSGDPVEALRLLTGPAWSGATIKAGSDQARELLDSWSYQS